MRESLGVWGALRRPLSMAPWSPAPRRDEMPDQFPAADVIAVPIQRASLVSGMSRSAIYRELAAGNLRAVKHGARTLVLMDSIRAYVEGLPTATFQGLPVRGS
jgi:hypothetical protein